MSRFNSWLWPDKNIGKRESRRLREEHNALINSHAELLEALNQLEKTASKLNQMQHTGIKDLADEWSALYSDCALAKATIAKSESRE